jgi:hypothetical protein
MVKNGDQLASRAPISYKGNWDEEGQVDLLATPGDVVPVSAAGAFCNDIDRGEFKKL